MMTFILSIPVFFAGLEGMSVLCGGVVVIIFIVIALLSGVVYFSKELEERDRQNANDIKAP